MDERRHNMDGALFVDDERDDLTSERARSPQRTYDDGKADAARRVTQGILDRMDLEATVQVREDDERVVLDIDGPDAGRAIGKKGMTLEALQFLVNKIVNRDPDERRHIVLDSGDYRERHDQSLVSMAKREAKRAMTSGRAITLEPMSARDRRVIHVSLAKFAGVSTRSEGEGMDRRLQIIPARGERGRDTGERGRDTGERGRDARPRERVNGRDERPQARGERPAGRGAAGRPERTSGRSEQAREVRAPRDAGDGERVRDDRPQDDRPRTSAPYDERAREERPRTQTAFDERAREERPRTQTAFDERAREERPRTQTAFDERAREERPHAPATPYDERAREERPASDERTRGERPRTQAAFDERAREERPRTRAAFDERAPAREDSPREGRSRERTAEGPPRRERAAPLRDAGHAEPGGRQPGSDSSYESRERDLLDRGRNR